MCSSCTGGLVTARRKTVSSQPRVITECTYTLEQLQNWKEKLKCTKSSGTFGQIGLDVYTINSYLGIVQSAINYVQNPCYFKEHLDVIYNVVQKIVQLNLCTT